MRNRAKCKLCGDIIESLHPTDYIQCSCGQISIDGGNENYRCWAKDWLNFIRIDQEGHEIQPTIINKEENPKEEEKSAPSRKELIDMLCEMSKTVDRLPDHAMIQPITHYDWFSLLTLLSAIFKAD